MKNLDQHMHSHGRAVSMGNAENISDGSAWNDLLLAAPKVVAA